ncbi:hypothetical protein ACIBQX_30785 [Nonomuraea sp. NPDC049714]|uniref:hypothetical protein n=1 Tax=Nonomuraea sp. NPDC049714 TaxID=3364357 RepID=UPI00379EA7FC
MAARIFAALVLVVAFLTVGGVGTALACSCADIAAKQRMRDSDAVFTATATAVQVDEEMLGGGQVIATLHADHVYKGDPGREIEVVTKAQGAACGYDFVAGRRYLIFAKARPEGLTTSLCSGNRDVPPGDRPLRPSDRTSGFTPLDPELFTALGTPHRPALDAPDPTPASAAHRPDTTSGDPVPLAVLALVAIVLTAGLAWAIRRFRRAG